MKKENEIINNLVELADALYYLKSLKGKELEEFWDGWHEYDCLDIVPDEEYRELVRGWKEFCRTGIVRI